MSMLYLKACEQMFSFQFTLLAPASGSLQIVQAHFAPNPGPIGNLHLQLVTNGATLLRVSWMRD
jgi:hypothetical protein